MTLLDVIEVKSNGHLRRIELHYGDLTDLSADEAVDLLVVSAFPDDYTPTLTSLIGALHRKGIRVRDLATQKAVDLRQTHSCWLSHPIHAASPGIQFDRILCFEPQVRGEAPNFVGDIFRALTPIIAGDPQIRTAAMPIVASGDQGFSITTMLPPLIDAAVHWMEIGVPLETLKIFAYSDNSAQESRVVFAQVKNLLVPHSTANSGYEYDVFVSYSRANGDAAEGIKCNCSITPLQR